MPLQGPGSHQPSRPEGGGPEGGNHCDLLLFRLYVRGSIYHVLYLSTSRPPCLPSMSVCVAAVRGPGSRGRGLHVSGDTTGRQPSGPLGTLPLVQGLLRARAEPFRWFVTQIGPHVGGKRGAGETGTLPVSRSGKGLCGPAPQGRCRQPGLGFQPGCG